MYIGYDDEQEALRQELRAYYDELLTPEIKADLAREHGIGPRTRSSSRRCSGRRVSPCTWSAPSHLWKGDAAC